MESKKKLYIWGAGEYLNSAYEAVNKELCTILGIVDRDQNKWNSYMIGGLSVQSPLILRNMEWDYILISVKNYRPILNECNHLGIDNNRIISFWNLTPDSCYVDYKVKRILELEEKVREYRWKLENLPYELGLKEAPIVKSSEELLNHIVESKCSLCRFGDGEFEMMRGNERPWFQNVAPELSVRLQEVLHSADDNIAIAIADDFGSLDCYTEKAANAIREYVYGDTRNEVMKFLDLERIYYNAYVSRPYIMYKDKNYAAHIFELFQKIWNDRDILIIEGEHSKMGVKNSLFANAGGIRRVLCPEKNAFDQYEIIFSYVKSAAHRDELILISLGPTATLLAYDLAKCGYQALDIGQIDNEYEWFLCKTEERIEIPGKQVAELSWHRQDFDMVQDEDYEKEIIKKIGID